MRIGIDIRYLSHNLVGGVHSYVFYLVPALLECAPDDQFFLYADSKNHLELSKIPPNTKIRTLPYRNGFSSVVHDLKTLKTQMAADEVEVAHFPANYGFGPANAKTVITLHDEINIMPWMEIIRGHSKNPRTITMMSYLHLCSSAAMRQADLILTVSEYSKRKISHFAPEFNPQQIAVVHSAISPAFEKISEQDKLRLVREKYQLTQPFILADALKNPGVIVRAWKRLSIEQQKNCQIVFFSRRPDVLPIVTEAVETGIARLLLRPPREDLIALFNEAKVFVFPSWIEGFGLPLLEAMACGAPVIASNRGSIPEVAGDAAILIEAEDDEALAEHLIQLLSSPEDAAGMRKRGFARASQFTWRQSAQKIITLYKALLRT